MIFKSDYSPQSRPWVDGLWVMHGSNGSLFFDGSMVHGSEPLTQMIHGFFIDYLLNFIIDQNNQVAQNNYAYLGLECSFFNSLCEADYFT